MTVNNVKANMWTCWPLNKRTPIEENSFILENALEIYCERLIARGIEIPKVYYVH